jgi:extradiol dioxygenase family protein
MIFKDYIIHLFEFEYSFCTFWFHILTIENSRKKHYGALLGIYVSRGRSSMVILDFLWHEYVLREAME